MVDFVAAATTVESGGEDGVLLEAVEMAAVGQAQVLIPRCSYLLLVYKRGVLLHLNRLMRSVLLRCWVLHHFHYHLLHFLFHCFPLTGNQVVELLKGDMKMTLQALAEHPELVSWVTVETSQFEFEGLVKFRLDLVLRLGYEMDFLSTL